MTNYFILGDYYHFVEKNYDLMKKYYLMAIAEGNSMAMNNLGVYYHKVEKKYGLMKKYYLMAIECGTYMAMNNLGVYYHFVEKNYDLMKKYYLMAIENGSINAMDNLGIYYHFVEKNYDLMKKYFLMAAKNGHNDGTKYLKKYYDRYIDLSFINLLPSKSPEITRLVSDLINEYLYNPKYISYINETIVSKLKTLNLSTIENINNEIKLQHSILKKTGIYPSNYNAKYLVHYIEIISLRGTKCPKDILFLIAGKLFA